jgi:hypothetical protein
MLDCKLQHGHNLEAKEIQKIGRRQRGLIKPEQFCHRKDGLLVRLCSPHSFLDEDGLLVRTQQPGQRVSARSGRRAIGPARRRVAAPSGQRAAGCRLLAPSSPRPRVRPPRAIPARGVATPPGTVSLRRPRPILACGLLAPSPRGGSPPLTKKVVVAVAWGERERGGGRRLWWQ